MNHNNELLAGVLRQGSRALAGYAAGALLEEHPDAEQGFRPDPFSGWQDWLAVRVEEMAAAVAAGRPQLFVSQVHWGTEVLQSRGIASESFRQGLECLRDVLAEELPEPTQPLAKEYLARALAAMDEPRGDTTARLLPHSEMGRVASTYVLVLLEGDRRGAARLILEAFDQGHEIHDLYEQVLLPAQAELGRMWVDNEINVAEEHFASQTTKMVMAQLLLRADIRPPNGKTMIAAAVAGNQHDIGLQAVADFFEIDGWRTVLLGANVPTRDLVQAADCFAADLIGLSVSQMTQFEDVKAAVRAVRDGTPQRAVKIMLGGNALYDSGDLSKELGADGYASGPSQAVTLGRRLVGLS